MRGEDKGRETLGVTPPAQFCWLGTSLEFLQKEEDVGFPWLGVVLWVPSPRAAVMLTALSFSFLGYVDMLGVAYEAPTLATGYGAYLAQVSAHKWERGAH